LAGKPRGDQLGEVGPYLQLGRSVEWKDYQLLRDGSGGGPAVLRFRGRDALDPYINITGVGSFTMAIEDDFRAFVDLGLDVVETITLAPGADHVEVQYTFYNPSDHPVATTYGTITDTGADVEVWHPRTGFGETGFEAL